MSCVFMNINKNVKNKGKSLKYKQADFIPILSLLHVFISSVIQFDKSIHPVVLYEYYLICIFMNISTTKKWGKPRKNYKPKGRGDVVGYMIYLALRGRFLMHDTLFSGTPWMRKKVVLKNKHVCAIGKCMVSTATNNVILKTRVHLQNQS